MDRPGANARVCKRLTAYGVALLLIATTRAGDSVERMPDCHGDFNSRIQALALLQTLNADLLSHDSATLTLERWCDAHKLASPAHVIAERMHDVEKAPTDEIRQLLDAKATDLIRYRRVRLRCGQHVLSEADNWYVPARLTSEMNQVLETTDTAFGRAVQALHFQRRTLTARLLWSPLPAGWEMGVALPRTSTRELAIPSHVIEHRAILALPDGTPFSVVVESYTGEVLALPKPLRSGASPNTSPSSRY
jgi:chorismate-pyruvate lyase